MIDWMALNGINAPLMPLGHLAIQRLMLRDYGMTDMDWTPGPGFLSWARMGNLQKWAGPPSNDWVVRQLDLGIQVAQLGILFTKKSRPSPQDFWPIIYWQYSSRILTIKS